MKTKHMYRSTSSGVDVWRVQKDEPGVEIVFSVPSIQPLFYERWSIEPDPKSKALAAYVARQIDAAKEAGFAEVTATQFQRALDRRAEQTFEGADYVESPAAAKRSKLRDRYAIRASAGEAGTQSIVTAGA